MQFKRALFIRFGGLGDILLTTPTLRAVYTKFPGVKIDYIVGGGMAEAIAGHPYVNKVIVFDKRGIDSRIDRFLPFLFRLYLSHYDLVINLHPSIKSCLMAFMAGARKQIVFHKNMEISGDTGQVMHAIDDFAKEVSPLGIGDIDHSMDFYIPDTAHQKVDEILREHGVTPDTKILLINPAASRPINRWPVSRFQNVCRHFVNQENTAVILTGAPRTFKTVIDGLDEIELADCIASVDSRIINLAGHLSVKELGALISRTSAFLTCDTGPMHIAVALDAPMVLLSGAADPARTGPYIPHPNPLLGKERGSASPAPYQGEGRDGVNATVLIDRSLSCVPCRDRICARGDVLCMQNITLNAVIDAISEHMYGKEGKSARVPLKLADQ